MNAHEKMNLKLAEELFKAQEDERKAKNKAAGLKDIFTAEMDEQGTDELIIGEYRITRGQTVAQVFSSKEFRKDHPKYYEQYKRPQVRNHFHIDKQD